MASIVVYSIGISTVRAEQICSDVMVVFARGSGQPSGNSNEDRENKKEQTMFLDRMLAHAPKGINLVVQQLEYPAIGANVNLKGLPFWFDAKFSLNEKNSYLESESEGVQNAYELLNKQVNSCPNQRFVLGGYSQGAQVMGDLFQQAGSKIRDKIAYAALFGDPKFNRDSFSARGDYYYGSHGLIAARSEYPDDLRGKISSWCKSSDGICEGKISTAFGDISRHNTYPEREIPVAVNEAVLALRSYYSAFDSSHIQPGIFADKADIAIVSESTAQMRTTLQVLQNQNQWFQKLTSISPDLRLGLVVYNDKQNSCGMPQPVVLSDLTSEANQFKSQFNAMFGQCGGGHSDGYAALDKALHSMSWRPDARRAIIWLAANYPNDPDKINSFHAENIINDARSTPIKIYGSFRSNSFAAQQKYSYLVGGMGGEALFYPVDQGFPYDSATSMLNLANELPNLPFAHLNAVRAERIGSEIHFNAGGSFDPHGRISTYEWDFDNNGTIDAVTTSPSVNYAYTTAYSGLATVKITTNGGKTTVDSVSVSISNANPVYQKPSAVSGLNANITSSGSVMLNWSSPSALRTLSTTATPLIDNYIVRDISGEIVGIVDGSTNSIEITDLPHNQPISFSVEATNTEGSSLANFSNTITIDTPEPTPNPITISPIEPSDPSFGGYPMPIAVDDRAPITHDLLSNIVGANSFVIISSSQGALPFATIDKSQIKKDSRILELLGVRLQKKEPSNFLWLLIILFFASMIHILHRKYFNKSSF